MVWMVELHDLQSKWHHTLKKEAEGMEWCILISWIINQSVLAMFDFLHSLTSLLGCVSHLSECNVITGRAAQLCKVWPPMMQLATPDMVVLASKLPTSLSSNNLVMAWTTVDFPVPSSPWTIIKHWGGSLPFKCSKRWFLTMSRTTTCCKFKCRESELFLDNRTRDETDGSLSLTLENREGACTLFWAGEAWMWCKSCSEDFQEETSWCQFCICWPCSIVTDEGKICCLELIVGIFSVPHSMPMSTVTSA